MQTVLSHPLFMPLLVTLVVIAVFPLVAGYIVLVERKVLADFTEQGRLKGVPASERKRLVILRWFARKFEPGRRYSELEVNATIAEFINDFASIRRYLVDHGLMERRSSVYWRVETAE